MLVFIRADASYTIGSGHVMRCLTLADRLKASGADVRFISRDFPGNLTDYIENRGFPVYLLPSIIEEKVSNNNEFLWLGTDWKTDAEETRSVLGKFSRSIDWLIVDQYGIDYKWQSIMRDLVNNIMVIDDLADRKHDCELLLDQNILEHQSLRYSNFASKQCRLILGPQYALLRPEFRKVRMNLPQRNGFIERINVFFGGSDFSNATLKTLKAIADLPINIDVIVGRINRNIGELEKFVSGVPNIEMHYDVSNMAQLMTRADLAIGASGSVSWERCCLGLPTIIISVAKNQESIGLNLERVKSAIYLGRIDMVDSLAILKKVQYLMQAPSEVKKMGQNALQLVDGLGAERVSNIIFSR